MDSELAVAALPQHSYPANRWDEHTLLRRCAARDRTAWRDLHRAYYPCAAAFLRKLGVRNRELEDACQEVFLQAYRCLDTFRGEAQFRTWLYRLCITEARRVRRRSHLTQKISAWLRLSPPEAHIAGPDLSDSRLKSQVEAALSSLSEGERIVFVLFELEGLSGAEVAEIAGCPVATVWRRLHDARQTFRAAIESCSRGGES
jgi:RNA polymerase sigma-70 factor (ECF subfamily)